MRSGCINKRPNYPVGEAPMLKIIAVIGLGLAFGSLPAIAQTDESTNAPAAKAPTGSHKSQMRHRHTKTSQLHQHKDNPN
jgi:hypothetical protein